MAKLPRYDLVKDKKADTWKLEKGNQTIKTFERKADATKGGVLKKTIGGEGSVRIHKENNRMQEERTFPRSKDPKSKG
jgi:hypothetical protein